MKFPVELRRVRELFIFTEKEKRGIIILLCLIFLLTAADFLLPSIFGENRYDFTRWENEIDEYFASRDSIEPVDTMIILNFDPNEVDSVKLISKGVSARVARNWCKYLEAGGRFKRKEDLRKIYGMTSGLYNRLETNIRIPSEQGRIIKSTFGDNKASGSLLPAEKKISGKKTYEPVNLNEADSARLENLPGIGPVLAPRIIRFRKILGGFYSVAQLKEVYGMRPENYSMVSPYLFVKEGDCQKFNINFSTLSELGHHPYIGYRTARKILDLRDKRGKFMAAGELTCLMGGDSLKKVIPYLTFGP
jgi:DNA uptake protein ComE-like DNA-binding protein